ncbi:MAG: DNA translocase FtsK, partial [Peptococcaceae bacterium]|nr:DNA translocase FtsK [Peptococcaceae bacterium]
YRASEYVIIPKEKPVILNSLAEIHKALDEQEPRVGLSPREPVKTEPYLIADSVDDFQQLLDKRQVSYTMKTMDASGTDRFMKERSEKQAAMDMKLKKEEAVHTAETMKKAEKKAEPVKEESKVEPQKPSKEKQDIPKQVEEVLELFPQEPEITGYQLPSIELLDVNTHTGGGQNRNDVMANVERLEKTLHDFGVKGKIADVSCGPAITQYEFQPAAGVKVSKIVNLSDDIALSMAVAGVRIEAPIPGKAAVGIEIPNKSTTMVGLRELIESDAFQNSKSKLTVALGKDISGNAIVADLAKMPHLLIAGSTGSGKSVCINTLINSILYKATPDEVKFVMVDPKKVELGNYNGIPHLISPVVTDAKKAAAALRWAVHEMDRRYEVFANAGVKDMPRFNKLSEERMAAAQTEEEKEAIEIMPYIVVLIDELADLMMVAPADVEDAICRLAQLARAAGIHLVVATQRPSVDVITGIIKANMPSRIAFAVSSQTDSRTILDMGGAEKLLGRGDMLFYPTGMPKPQRVQGVYVSDGEIERITDAVKNQAQPVYNEEIGTAVVNTETSGDQEEEWDDLIPEATKLFIENGQASISLLQRRFRVGYTRAARIVDQMEQRGLVGPYEGSKPRQIKVTMARYNEMIENGEL